ncbi:hypothetical protein EMPG_10107, partial [Blastomyces silverae]
KIEEIQVFKLTFIILNVNLIMKKIHSHLNSLKEKKSITQLINTSVNVIQIDTAALNSSSNNINNS